MLHNFCLFAGKHEPTIIYLFCFHEGSCVGAVAGFLLAFCSGGQNEILYGLLGGK